MKATLPQGNNISIELEKYRKINKFKQQISVVDKDFNEVICVRFYSTQSTSYCCVWITDSKNQKWLTGGNKSSGYGYHRASEAFERALKTIGVNLDTDIGGRGDRAVLDACEAIMRALGYRKFGIVTANA